MKKRIIVLLLLLTTVFTLSLSSCQKDGSGEPIVNEPPESEEELLLLPKEKLEGALAEAIKKIDYALPTFTRDFPSHNSTGNVYEAVDNTSGWNQGFWTGILWHAYELTGYENYKNVATSQISSFFYRIQDNVGVNHHDMGFLYIPSCLAAYKITGNQMAKIATVMAAKNLADRYRENGRYIQASGNVGANQRMIVDTLLNIPILYWVSEETGDEKYSEIAYSHFNTTLAVCFREDGSTYQACIFDKNTGEPIKHGTSQGAGDETTWSRGQSWAVYGSALTYKYTRDEEALAAFKSSLNYYIKNLPEDYVAYWDLSFKSGDEPRDSSSAAIALCGILEGIKYLDDSDPDKEVYIEAAKNIMSSLIDNYTTKDVPHANGLILHGTYNNRGNVGVDEMNIWGDYFYMEALHRMLDPEWCGYW